MTPRKASPLVADVSATNPCTPLQRHREEYERVEHGTADVFYTPRTTNTKPLMDKTNVIANLNGRPALTKLPRPTSLSASPSPEPSNSSSKSFNYVPTASRLAVRSLKGRRSPSPTGALPSPAQSTDGNQSDTPSKTKSQPRGKIPVAKDKPLPSPPIVQVIGTSPKRSSRTLIDAEEKPLRRSVGTFEEGEWPSLSPERPLRSTTSGDLRPPSHQNIIDLKRSSTTASVTSTVSSNASIRTAKTCVTQKARSPVTVTFSRASAASSPNLSRINTPLKTEFSTMEKDSDKDVVNFSRPHSVISEAASPPSHLGTSSSTLGPRATSWCGPAKTKMTGVSRGTSIHKTSKVYLSPGESADNMKAPSATPISLRDVTANPQEDGHVSRVRNLTTGKGPSMIGPRLTIRKGTHKILTGQESHPNLLRSPNSEIPDKSVSAEDNPNKEKADKDSPSKSSTSSHYRKASPHANLLIKARASPNTSIPVPSPKASNETFSTKVSPVISEKKKVGKPMPDPVTSLFPKVRTSKTSHPVPPMRTKDKIMSKFQRKEDNHEDTTHPTSRLKRLNFFKKRSSTPSRPSTPPTPGPIQATRSSGPPIPRRNSARLRVVGSRPAANANDTPPAVPRKALDSARLHNPAYSNFLRAQSGIHSPRAPIQAARDKPPPTPPKDTAQRLADPTAPRKVAHALLQRAKALPSSSSQKAQLLNMAEVLVKTIVASNEAEVSRVRAEEGAKQARIACGVAKGALGVMMGMAKGITLGKRLEARGEK